jgi:hypothetical protein
MSEREDDTNVQIVARGDDGALAERGPVDALLWSQAHRAAAQAAVATALGVRVLLLELREGPPPLGVVHLATPDTNADTCTHPDAPGKPTTPPDFGRVRLLAYTVAGPIAERVAGVGGIPLQGETAYLLSTAVLAQMRQPAGLDAEGDEGEIARLLLNHFGERLDDAAEAAEHLALNVETWVCQHWGAIAHVAANLLRYRQLTGDGVRQLMPPEGSMSGLGI